jgi:hypothetical protein
MTLPCTGRDVVKGGARLAVVLPALVPNYEGHQNREAPSVDPRRDLTLHLGLKNLKIPRGGMA